MSMTHVRTPGLRRFGGTGRTNAPKMPGARGAAGVGGSHACVADALGFSPRRYNGSERLRPADHSRQSFTLARSHFNCCGAIEPGSFGTQGHGPIHTIA